MSLNIKETLAKAQERFGYRNQIVVTSEELAELTQALLKYLRYPNHEEALDKTRENVIEEMADVMICLGHVEMIFGVKQEELDEVIRAKMERMERWLASGKGFEQTTVDRKWK